MKRSLPRRSHSARAEEPLAAYLYLPRPAGAKGGAHHGRGTRPRGSSFDVQKGTPIGVSEITAPALVSVAQLNELLVPLGGGPR